MQRLNITSMDRDTREILRVHKQWWKANVGLDFEAMQACFPSGDAFSMFNRNGFTYFGVEELTKLWEHYAEGPPRLIQTVAVLRLAVSSDIAWLICELKYRRVSPVTPDEHWDPANGEALRPAPAPWQPRTCRLSASNTIPSINLTLLESSGLLISDITG